MDVFLPQEPGLDIRASTALGEACRRVSLPPGASTEIYYLITSMSHNIIGLILLLILVENSWYEEGARTP